MSEPREIIVGIEESASYVEDMWPDEVAYLIAQAGRVPRRVGYWQIVGAPEITREQFERFREALKEAGDEATLLVVEDVTLKWIEAQPAASSPALTREALAAALHKVYCREGAPMHSAPDHSAGRILEAALSKTPPPSSTREETP